MVGAGDMGRQEHGSDGSAMQQAMACASDSPGVSRTVYILTGYASCCNSTVGSLVGPSLEEEVGLEDMWTSDVPLQLNGDPIQ